MLITPPKFGGGFGTYLPSTVVVAVGEPGVPVICWAGAERAAAMMAATNIAYARMYLFGFMFPPLCFSFFASGCVFDWFVHFAFAITGGFHVPSRMAWSGQ